MYLLTNTYSINKTFNKVVFLLIYKKYTYMYYKFINWTYYLLTSLKCFMIQSNVLNLDQKYYFFTFYKY